MTQPTVLALSEATLDTLPETVERPRYDRSRLTPGIVHIGVGNFHRAHQAWYVHRLMQMGEALDWAIIGAGVRPTDAVMREKLLRQDHLTTLIELDPAGTRAEVTGALIDFLPVEIGHTALIRQMADPAIRIVSLTVTEGGYFLDASGAFDKEHPDIQADAASPDAPMTAFGAIVAALELRRKAGTTPFTVLSCDNLQGNGRVLQQTVLGVAQLVSQDLSDWIAAHVAFPNSMVDCIVPATGDAERAVARSMGIDDQVPVTHENFRQWVIEDRFCNGRPRWDKVGAVFAGDVHNYEAMKLRILNGGHQLLANAGELLSVHTISGCMQDPLISAFFDRVQRSEILPNVQPVPGMTPPDYLTLISKRFSNHRIVDQTRRVAFDGASRHRGFLHPSIQDQLSADASIDGLALAEALWARMCSGTREDGSQIAPNDPNWTELNALALRSKDNPNVWLENESIYGGLSRDPRISSAFCRWLRSIWDQGVKKTLKTYLD